MLFTVPRTVFHAKAELLPASNVLNTSARTITLWPKPGGREPVNPFWTLLLFPSSLIAASFIPSCKGSKSKAFEFTIAGD